MDTTTINNQQQDDDDAISSTTTTIATADLCRIIQTNMQQLEKSLRCPVCLSCCKNATYISGCFHVYCYKCITNTLRSTNTRCPTCNQNFTRRSLISAAPAAATQFDDLVFHYKKASQAFGLAPLEPNRNLQMTQLLPSQQSSGASSTSSMDNNNNNNNNSNEKQQEDQNNSWKEKVEYYQVANTFLKSFQQQQASSSITTTTNGNGKNNKMKKNSTKDNTSSHGNTAATVVELKAVVASNRRSMMRTIEKRQKYHAKMAKISECQQQQQQQYTATTHSQLQREALDQQAADANLLDSDEDEENEHDDDVHDDNDDLDQKPAAINVATMALSSCDDNDNDDDDIFYSAQEEPPETQQQPIASNNNKPTSNNNVAKKSENSNSSILDNKDSLLLPSAPALSKMMPFVTTTRGGGCKKPATSTAAAAASSSSLLQFDSDDDDDDELPPFSGLYSLKSVNNNSSITTRNGNVSTSSNKANEAAAAAAAAIDPRRFQKSSSPLEQQQQGPTSTIVVTNNNQNAVVEAAAPLLPSRTVKRQKVGEQENAAQPASLHTSVEEAINQPIFIAGGQAALHANDTTATTSPTSETCNSSAIVTVAGQAQPANTTTTAASPHDIQQEQQKRTANIVSLPRNHLTAREPQPDRGGEQEEESVVDESSFRTDAPVVMTAGNGNMVRSLQVDRAAASVAAVAAAPGPSHLHQTTRATTTSVVSTAAFPIGSVVIVQARTWPGYNKQGGVGRITKVHQGGGSILYDIKYILGGREKQVDNAFVSLQADNLGTVIKEEEEEEGDKQMGGERRSSHRERKTSHRLEQQRAELPPALLAKLQAEGFDTKPRVGGQSTKVLPVDAKENTQPLKQSRHTKQEENGDTKQSSRRKRGNEGNKNDDEEKPRKRRRIAQAIISTVTGLLPKTQRRVQPAPQPDILPDLTPKEVCINADKLYGSRFASAIKTHSTIHVVASMLSATEMDALHKLCKSLKKGPVQIKVSDSFHPTKTTLCITPAETIATSREETSNLVSKHRTVKCMRAALAGVPVVSPLWIQVCQEAQKVVPPTAEMFVRTFPSKVGSQADFGVALLAAAAQCNGHFYHPLQEHSVYLCGTFSKNVKSDVGLLLREAGATIITHPASTVAKIKSLSESDGGSCGNKLVLLCADGSSANAGISPALERQVMDQPENILVVNLHWLFATVSSGRSASSSEAFRPQSSKAGVLWEATVATLD